MVEVYRALTIKVKLSRLPQDVRDSVVCFVRRFMGLCNLWVRGYTVYPPDIQRSVLSRITYLVDRSWLGTRPKKWFCKIAPPLDVGIRIGNERDCGQKVFIDVPGRVIRLRGFIPRKAITIPLSDSAIRYILERVKEGGKPKCALLRVDSRFLYIHIVFARPRPGKYSPETILAIDVNSWLYGISWGLIRNCRVVSLGREVPDIPYLERLYNHVIVLEKKLGRLRRLGLKGTYEYAKLNVERKACRSKLYRYLRDFCNRTVHKLVRKALRYRALIVIDPVPDVSIRQLVEEGLSKGFSKITLTYVRRFIKLLENQADWYGIPIIFKHLPSTVCPYCENKLIDIGNRRMRCTTCNIEVNRDYIPILHAAKQYEKLINNSKIDKTAREGGNTNEPRATEPPP